MGGVIIAYFAPSLLGLAERVRVMAGLVTGLVVVTENSEWKLVEECSIVFRSGNKMIIN